MVRLALRDACGPKQRVDAAPREAIEGAFPLPRTSQSGMVASVAER